MSSSRAVSANRGKRPEKPKRRTHALSQAGESKLTLKTGNRLKQIQQKPRSRNKNPSQRDEMSLCGRSMHSKALQPNTSTVRVTNPSVTQQTPVRAMSSHRTKADDMPNPVHVVRAMSSHGTKAHSCSSSPLLIHSCRLTATRPKTSGGFSPLPKVECSRSGVSDGPHRVKQHRAISRAPVVNMMSVFGTSASSARRKTFEANVLNSKDVSDHKKPRTRSAADCAHQTVHKSDTATDAEVRKHIPKCVQNPTPAATLNPIGSQTHGDGFHLPQAFKQRDANCGDTHRRKNNGLLVSTHKLDGRVTSVSSPRLSPSAKSPLTVAPTESTQSSQSSTSRPSELSTFLSSSSSVVREPPVRAVPQSVEHAPIAESTDTDISSALYESPSMSVNNTLPTGSSHPQESACVHPLARANTTQKATRVRGTKPAKVHLEKRRHRKLMFESERQNLKKSREQLRIKQQEDEKRKDECARSAAEALRKQKAASVKVAQMLSAIQCEVAAMHYGRHLVVRRGFAPWRRFVVNAKYAVARFKPLRDRNRFVSYMVCSLMYSLYCSVVAF